MTLQSFTQKIVIPTSALDVYTIFLDERRHSSFTGDIAVIHDAEGAKFTLYDGLITGKNEVLERGQKIIWSFAFVDANWPANHFSEAALILNSIDNKSCEVELYHTAIPEDFIERVEKFWNEMMWEPLTYYLER